MNSRNLGGRGNKSPFPTVVRRIPTALIPEINQRTRELYKGISRDVEINFHYVPKFEDTRNICIHILRQKKSAKKSLEMFLKFLHNDQNIDLDD